MSDELNRVAHAAERVNRLEPQLKEARAELRQSMIDAYLAGAEPITLARITQLSRQRVHQILQQAGHNPTED